MTTATTRRALSRHVPTLLATLLLAPMTALAGTPINETRSVGASPDVAIHNVRGSVNVGVWDRNEIQVTGTLGDGSKGLTFDADAGRVEIRVRTPEDKGWFNWSGSNSMQDSVLDIKLPKASSLKVEVVSAAVAIDGIDSRSVDIDSVSGKVRLDLRVRDLSIESVSGNIEMTGHAEDASFETVSANIKVRAGGGDFEFESVSGDVDAELDGAREAKASTVSGDLRIGVSGNATARIELESMSGDVQLTVPTTFSGRIQAETFSGSLRSDLGSIVEPKYGPGRSLDVAGSGDGRIRVESFSGDIAIRRRE